MNKQLFLTILDWVKFGLALLSVLLYGFFCFACLFTEDYNITLTYVKNINNWHAVFALVLAAFLGTYLYLQAVTTKQHISLLLGLFTNSTLYYIFTLFAQKENEAGIILKNKIFTISRHYCLAEKEAWIPTLQNELNAKLASPVRIRSMSIDWETLTCYNDLKSTVISILEKQKEPLIDVTNGFLIQAASWLIDHKAITVTMIVIAGVACLYFSDGSRGAINAAFNSVKTLSKNQAGLNQTVTDVGTQVAALGAEITGLREDLTRITSAVAGVNSTLRNFAAMISSQAELLQDYQEKHNILNKIVDGTLTSITSLNNAITSLLRR